jgi:hypothetical protein
MAADDVVLLQFARSAAGQDEFCMRFSAGALVQPASGNFGHLLSAAREDWQAFEIESPARRGSPWDLPRILSTITNTKAQGIIQWVICVIRWVLNQETSCVDERHQATTIAISDDRTSDRDVPQLDSLPLRKGKRDS